MDKKTVCIKIIAVIVVVACMATAGYLFWEHRNYKEPVVLGDGVTEVKKLSDYSDVVEGTINDCNVYIMDSGVEGGTMLVFARTHPEEPTGPMVTNLMIENMKVTQGKVIVINSLNTSGTTYTRNGEAYPRYFTYETDWGVKKWRYGDRTASPLDSWPDPEVYLHYPSGQSLAYMDIRNANRNWPGKEGGLLTERTAYAVMQLIEQEGVDLSLDLHEAELEYTVENTIVAHQRGTDVAAMVSMTLTATTFDVPVGAEFSPLSLHGLCHREVGDYSDCIPFLVEVAEPMLDRIRGITDEQLLMSGKDVFVIEAGKHGLLYAPIDESGWPIEKRVARHLSVTTSLMDFFGQLHPEAVITVEGLPAYEEMLQGLGSYYHDPATVDPSRIAYD